MLNSVDVAHRTFITIRDGVNRIERHRFDALTKSLVVRRIRRDVLRGMVAVGAVVAGAAVLTEGGGAARRGYAGPMRPGTRPSEPCIPACGEEICAVPDGCDGMCGCEGSDTWIENECKAECEIMGVSAA